MISCHESKIKQNGLEIYCLVLCAFRNGIRHRSRLAGLLSIRLLNHKKNPQPPPRILSKLICNSEGITDQSTESVWQNNSGPYRDKITNTYYVIASVQLQATRSIPAELEKSGWCWRRKVMSNISNSAEAKRGQRLNNRIKAAVKGLLPA